ncbi:MAG: UDP-N-acetylglucosamine 2-epimerase [Nanoarchaeota archaeon]
MLKEAKKIAIVIGTKAELIKCMPIMLELQKQKKDYWFIHTGQHPLEESCEEFGIKKPDFILSPEPKISTKFWSKINKLSIFWFLSMIFKIKEKIKEINPKYVIYHGDTMSTAAASIGSSKILNYNKVWKNVHLEAGLRSGSLWEPFPEEISRLISDRFSDILLAVSNLTEKNLKKSYQGKKIILKTGNTIVDSSWHIYKKIVGKFKKEKKEYVLINIHRHEHLRKKENLEKILEIINSIKTKGIWPMHDNTKHHLEKYKIFGRIDREKILITPLKNYEEFIFLMANCKYLIADGGSIQEESLVFKKPCLIIRNRTERQEGLATGLNFLVGINVKRGQYLIDKLEKKELVVGKFINPYGNVGLSKEIVEALK